VDVQQQEEVIAQKRIACSAMDMTQQPRGASVLLSRVQLMLVFSGAEALICVDIYFLEQRNCY